jgi:hypothetical protein
MWDGINFDNMLYSKLKEKRFLVYILFGLLLFHETVLCFWMQKARKYV